MLPLASAGKHAYVNKRGKTCCPVTSTGQHAIGNKRGKTIFLWDPVVSAAKRELPTIAEKHATVVERGKTVNCSQERENVQLPAIGGKHAKRAEKHVTVVKRLNTGNF